MLVVVAVAGDEVNCNVVSWVGIAGDGCIVVLVKPVGVGHCVCAGVNFCCWHWCLREW